MSVGPPEPPEFAQRLVGDTAARVRVAIEPIAARVAGRLEESEHWHPLIAGEELAGREVDELWYDENLPESYARALAEVHEQYLVNASRVLEVVADLEAAGRDSWIAKALRHQFAFRASWEAQDRLGLLTRFDDDEYCVACGGRLERHEGDDEEAAT